MVIPMWVAFYIGIPFIDQGRDHCGVDCWGLMRLIMSEQFGVALPSYSNEYQRVSQSEKVVELIDRESRKWDVVKPGDEERGDLVVLLVRGKPMHIGFVLGDKQMIHTQFGAGSMIEEYDGPRWEKRISGFYRYMSPLEFMK